MFMLGSKCFHRHPQFYCRIPVCADKLIMLQFNDIALGVCNRLCHPYELTRLIRKQDGDREDPVSLDQTMLYEAMVMTSIFPPLKMQTAFFPFKSN